MRSRLLFVLLSAMVLVAGCTNKEADDPADDPGTGDNRTGGTGGNGTADVTDFNLTDSGSIQGPFSQTWDIDVANVGFTNAMVHFSLSGAQAGAPPTARINLALLDPEGATVRSETVGLGGSGDSVEWSFTPADLPVAGTYQLTASSGDGSPLPSVGIANYELMAMVDY